MSKEITLPEPTKNQALLELIGEDGPKRRGVRLRGRTLRDCYNHLLKLKPMLPDEVQTEEERQPLQIDQPELVKDIIFMHRPKKIKVVEVIYGYNLTYEVWQRGNIVFELSSKRGALNIAQHLSKGGVL